MTRHIQKTIAFIALFSILTNGLGSSVAFAEKPPVCQIGNNLLSNGSFEADVVIDHDGEWQVFPSVTNWLVSLSDGLELWRSNFYGGPSEGIQNAELDGNSPTKITQSVVTTIGSTYELRFDFSARPDHDSSANNSVDVFTDDILLMNATADGSDIAVNAWKNYSKTFVATGSSTDISFADIGTPDSYGSLIDNAVLCLVTEPVLQCTPEAEGDWSDKIESFNQTKRQNDSNVLAIRSVANSALDNSIVIGSTGFVSLGFGGSIVVSFTNYVPNVIGNDIRVYETTDLPYPTETALVEVSQNGTSWVSVGSATNPGASNFDFDSTGFDWIKYVRVTDTSDLGFFTNDSEADGFDLNAVRATETVCEKPLVEDEDTEEVVCSADINLIQNGSFETPDLPADGFGWDIFDSTTDGLAWIVEWLYPTEGSPVPAKLELQSGLFEASKGFQYAELDSNWNVAPGGLYNGEDSRVRVYQHLKTIPGATYKVSYDFSPLPSYSAETNILSVLLDGVEIASHTKNGTDLVNTSWETYSYSFVATTTDSIIGFADAGIADSFGTLLDNVTAYCVPNVVVDEVEKETPKGGSTSGGGRGKRAVPTVAGDSISVPTVTPLVLGEQVSVVPQGAPDAGHGGASTQVNVLSISQLLLTPRNLRFIK